MIPRDAHDLIETLPARMQDPITGYVGFVDTVLPEIEDDAGIKLDKAERDLFLFLVTVRRIWGAVEGQYDIIDGSIAVAEKGDLQGFQIGSARFTRHSEGVQQVRNLRAEFARLIGELELTMYIRASTLSDLVQMVHGNR